MPSTYDTIVIGAGPGGEVCAGVLGQAGQRVAIVERELVAGECSYWACMPTKVLLRPPEAVEGARRAPGARRAVTRDADVAETLAWRDRIVHDYDDAKQLPWLEERGISCCAARDASPGLAGCASARSSTRPTPSCSRPARCRSSRRSPACASSRACGRTARPPGCEPSRGGCWCSAAARSASSSRRSCGAWAVRSRSSRAESACSVASRRASARRWGRRSPTTASSCTSGRTPPRRPATGTTTCCGSRTGRSSAVTGCSSRPAAARASTTWGWRRSASSPASAASRSTSGCAPATASGPSAT